MKKWIAVILILVLIPVCGASAGRQYIIPDSDTRQLTETELWQWSYESLGYILNEIFARHGYNFIPGAIYDNYFSQAPWYTPNIDPNNTLACYPKLTSVEWANERMIKDVMSTMSEMDYFNTEGLYYLDFITFDKFDVLSGFDYMNLKTGQKLSVYSAPSQYSYRGANGKAFVSTNGVVYVAGWEQGWLLIMYSTNNGAVRVGYVNGGELKGTVNAKALSFSYQPILLSGSAQLTDDPVTESTVIAYLSANTQVTYLSTFYNRKSWVYVETQANGQTVRGFIPSSAVDMRGIDEDDPGK